MFTIDVKVGRLLELRVLGPTVPEDLDRGRDRMAHYFKTIPGKLVACCDFSQASTFSPETAGRVLDTFRHDNPGLERSGILVSDSTIFSLQLERLVKHGDNPNRRCFRDPFELRVF